MRIHPACLLLVPFVFACRSANEIVAPPIDALEAHDTIWSYLAERYDANGDGQVTPDEYDRDQWERLDRNGHHYRPCCDAGERPPLQTVDSH